MSDQVYKTIELVGTSSEGMDQAVRAAIARAAKTVRKMSWFEVTETRGSIRDNGIAAWQVIVKIGFELDEPSDS